LFYGEGGQFHFGVAGGAPLQRCIYEALSIPALAAAVKKTQLPQALKRIAKQAAFLHA
jgi:hypothetical protein